MYTIWIFIRMFFLLSLFCRVDRMILWYFHMNELILFHSILDVCMAAHIWIVNTNIKINHHRIQPHINICCLCVVNIYYMAIEMNDGLCYMQAQRKWKKAFLYSIYYMYILKYVCAVNRKRILARGIWFTSYFWCLFCPIACSMHEGTFSIYTTPLRRSFNQKHQMFSRIYKSMLEMKRILSLDIFKIFSAILIDLLRFFYHFFMHNQQSRFLHRVSLQRDVIKLQI